MNTDRRDWLESIFRQAFSPTHLVVEDESWKHAGHEGARGGQSHFNAVIVTEKFSGLGPLARQRAVYAAVGDAMREQVHALTMTTLTPAEWTARNGTVAGHSTTR